MRDRCQNYEQFMSKKKTNRGKFMSNLWAACNFQNLKKCSNSCPGGSAPRAPQHQAGKTYQAGKTSQKTHWAGKTSQKMHFSKEASKPISLNGSGREIQFCTDFIENGWNYDGLRASCKLTYFGFIFYRKNECFWNLIYARPDGFHQNIMRGPMVFIFIYARLQSGEFLP